MVETIEDLRKWFAEEVMGWTFHDVNSEDFDDGYPELMGGAAQQYYKTASDDVIRKENWKPDTNLSQAFCVLETYCEVHEDKLSWSHGKNKRYWTNIINHDEPIGETVLNQNREFEGRDEKQNWSILTAVLKAEEKTEFTKARE